MEQEAKHVRLDGAIALTQRIRLEALSLMPQLHSSQKRHLVHLSLMACLVACHTATVPCAAHIKGTQLTSGACALKRASCVLLSSSKWSTRPAQEGGGVGWSARQGLSMLYGSLFLWVVRGITLLTNVPCQVSAHQLASLQQVRMHMHTHIDMHSPAPCTHFVGSCSHT